MRISNGEENCNSVSRHGPNYEYYTFGMDNDDVIDTTVTSSRSYYHHNADVRRAVDGIVYIAEQMQREDDVRNVSGGHSALTSVTSVSINCCCCCCCRRGRIGSTWLASSIDSSSSSSLSSASAARA